MSDVNWRAEARRLLEGASPRPWAALFIGGPLRPEMLDEWEVNQRITGLKIADCHARTLGRDNCNAEAAGNAALIAAAPDLLERALGALEERDAEVARLKALAARSLVLAQSWCAAMAEFGSTENVGQLSRDLLKVWGQCPACDNRHGPHCTRKAVPHVR